MVGRVPSVRYAPQRRTWQPRSARRSERLVACRKCGRPNPRGTCSDCMKPFASVSRTSDRHSDPEYRRNAATALPAKLLHCEVPGQPGYKRMAEIKQHYDRRRAAGDGHAAAMRNLFNRLLGCLHHCLQTGQTFDPAKAFPRTETQLEPVAA